MDEKYQVIDPGVSLADAEDVTFSFNGEHAFSTASTGRKCRYISFLKTPSDAVAGRRSR